MYIDFHFFLFGVGLEGVVFLVLEEQPMISSLPIKDMFFLVWKRNTLTVLGMLAYWP